MQGDELRALRKAAGLTQEELAGRLGLTPTFIGMMERGAKAIEPRTALATRKVIEDRFFVVGPSVDGIYAVTRRTITKPTPLQIHGQTVGYGYFEKRASAYRWALALESSRSPRRTRRVERSLDS